MANSRTPRRTTVPVASRERAAAQPKKKAPKLGRISLGGVAIIVAAVLLVLVAIAVPLRNYYEGRTEIARLEESIVAKQAEKDALLAEIERYENEDFIRQEARRRLGVIDEGETAWRILDPRMSVGGSVTTPHDAGGTEVPWHQTLWDAIAEPPVEPAAEAPLEMPVEQAPQEPEAGEEPATPAQ